MVRDLQTFRTMEPSSFAAIFRELILSFNEVVKGEVRLAKAEIKGTADLLRRDLFRLVIFSSIAAAGLLPLMAFLVIGLGDLLNDHYLWSSLIVALVFLGIGGSISYLAIRNATRLNYSLPLTATSIEERLEHLTRKLNELTSLTSQENPDKRSAA